MSRFKKIFHLTVIAACIIYLARFFNANRDSLNIIFKLNLPTIILIITISILYLILSSYRFQIVLEKYSGRSLPFYPWFKIFTLAQFFNMIFPQMGNVYRAVCLKKNHNISYTEYITGFTSFAWMDLCINMIIALAVILFNNPNFKIGRLCAWQMLLVIIIGIIIAPLLAGALLTKIRFKNAYLSWTRSKLLEMLTVTVKSIGDKTYMAKITLLGLIVFIQTVLAYYILFLSLNTPLSLPALAVFYSLLKLGTFANITPGNIGVQEVAFGFLSEQMNFGMAQGVLVSVFGRILHTSLIVVLGILFGGIDLLKHRKDYQSPDK